MDELVNCGCGGEAYADIDNDWYYFWIVKCPKCGIATAYYRTKSDAIEAWNRAMGKDINVPAKDAKMEEIAKVYHEDIVSHFLCGMCGVCGETIYDHAKYCSECGAKLDWSNDE